jgi:hypothetical protein
MEQDLINDIKEAEHSALSFFTPKWVTGHRNSEIYGLKHYTDEEEEKIVNQKRYPYKFDKISHAINTLLGMQRDSRFDIFFYEFEGSDALKAELYNAVWKHYADRSDFLHVESDVFQDAIVSTYGVFGCEMDYTEDVRGELKVFRAPFDEVMWDRDFRNYDLSDAQWLTRFRYIRKDLLKEQNPELKAMIELAMKEKRYAGGKDVTNFYVKPKQDLVAVHEYFQRGVKNVYLVLMDGDADFFPQVFKTEEEAGQFIQGLTETMNSAALSGQMTGNIPNLEIQPHPVKIINKSEMIINGMLKEPVETGMQNFTYTPFFSSFHDGKFWSMVDRLKDPQMFANRSYMQIDHWIGTMAKGLLWIDPRADSKAKKDIKEKFGTTGGIIEGKFPPQLIESRGPAPQLFSIIDKVETGMDDSLGGSNMLGQKQTASESGRAVLARQAQAGLDHFVSLDNMRRTKHSLGENIAWYLANKITAPRVLRIVGDSLGIQAMQSGGMGKWFKPSASNPSVGYVEINTEEENSLANIEVDVVIDEAVHATTKNWAVLNALTDAAKSGAIPPMPPQVAIELIPGIPQSLKMMWLKAVNAPKEEPMGKVSANYKDLPPDAKVAFLQSIGVESADMMGVIAKEQVDKTAPARPELTEKEKAGQV